MPADPRLMALPALRKLAEEEAREFYSINVTVGTIRLPTWDDMIPEAQALAATSFLSLLADLSRPASRDAVARLVGKALGLKCGATAPDLILAPSFCDGERTHSWLLVVPAGPAGFGRRWWSFHSEGEDPDGAEGWTLVPGVSAVTDPAEALTLIAIATLTTTD